MIRDKLKEVRERTGMNKKEFANYIGMKYTTYNNYETGAREPDSEFLIMISKKFNVSADFILGLQEDREILYSYELKASEYEYIEKYRSLDDPGRSHVNSVLNWEIERSSQLQQSQERITELEAQAATIIPLKESPTPYALNAAHARTDIPDSERTPELAQMEEDIMDDNNF